MNLLFFQNCISPHQIPYIRECVKNIIVDSVSLIVPRIDYNLRIKMGWNNKDLLRNTGIKCILRPVDEEVERLLNTSENSICLFSGIRADRDVFHWLKISFHYEVKRYIITEPPYTFGKPLWMHYLRFFLQDYQYVKYINGVFAIGTDAVSYYSNLYRHWKVFPFQYVTESVERTEPSPMGNTKMLFVGSLSRRKNVEVVLSALKGLDNIEFNIVGDGNEHDKLESYSKEVVVPCQFYGTKPMGEIPFIMQQNDILVLPSLHDGWGAVVNEAMGLGLYVIVSDKCGVRALVDSGGKGLVFKSNDVNDLKEKIQKCISNISSIRNNMLRRVAESEAIKGPSVAKYFINCLER